MDVEQGLLCAVLHEGDLAYAVERHIDAESFTDQKHQRVWTMVVDHWGEYGSVPDVEIIHRAYPSWHYEDPDQPLSWWVDEVRDRIRHRVLMQKVTEAFDETELEGPRPGARLLGHLREAVSMALAEVPVGTDVDYFEQWGDRVLPRLVDRMSHPGYLRGVSTGYHGIDRATGGHQPGQLITVVGTPKAGKSTILLDMALTARYEGRTALFFTFEMSALEQEDRLTSLISKVDVNHIQDGTMTRMELDIIRRSHRTKELLHGLTIVDDPTSSMTISAVRSKIRHYKPDVVFIDGAYLMHDELGEMPGTPRALTNITRGTKRMAQQEKIPILISTQALLARAKNGLQMDSVGYSSSFVQDSDVVLGAYDLGGGIKKFSVIAIRSGPKTETYVEIDWNKGTISEIESELVDLKVALAEQQTTGVKASSVSYEDEEEEAS